MKILSNDNYSGVLTGIKQKQPYGVALTGELKNAASEKVADIAVRPNVSEDGSLVFIMSIMDVENGFLSGLFFKNDKKVAGSSDPDYIGSVNTGLGDTRLRLNGWKTVKKEGETNKSKIVFNLGPVDLTGEYASLAIKEDQK